MARRIGGDGQDAGSVGARAAADARGVAPDAILCITFTKAGAAEMAHRIHERLALWVRMDDGDLRVDLSALGADWQQPGILDRARSLFATVIDSAPGAIRVQTIHSFCQTLLASFPLEAKIMPGFRALEEGEAAELQRQVLGTLLAAGRRRWRYDARPCGDAVAADGTGCGDGVPRALRPCLGRAVPGAYPAAARA